MKTNLKQALLGLMVTLIGAATLNAQTRCILNQSTVIEYDRYQHIGVRWIVLVVPAKTARECIIEYASKLHKENPRQQYEFFDYASPELAQYVRWAGHGMSDDYPYPEKWVAKHHVATLQVFAERQCRWTLHFEKGDDVNFDSYPPPCINGLTTD